MTSGPILEVPRLVFNKTTITMTDFLTSTLYLLGKPIESISIRASTEPGASGQMSDTNALSKLRYLQMLVTIAAEKKPITVFPISIDAITSF
jgi:hypothetical protein